VHLNKRAGSYSGPEGQMCTSVWQTGKCFVSVLEIETHLVWVWVTEFFQILTMYWYFSVWIPASPVRGWNRESFMEDWTSRNNWSRWSGEPDGHSREETNNSSERFPWSLMYFIPCMTSLFCASGPWSQLRIPKFRSFCMPVIIWVMAWSIDWFTSVWFLFYAIGALVTHFWSAEFFKTCIYFLKK